MYFLNELIESVSALLDTWKVLYNSDFIEWAQCEGASLKHQEKH